MIDPGTVLECPPGTWKFTGAPHTLFLRVHAVREDPLRGRGVDRGTQLARDGTPLGWMQALVTLERVRIVRSGRS